MNFYKMKKIRLNDKKESWIKECLKSYSWNDLEGNYILDSDKTDFICKEEVKGETVKINFGQFLNKKFYSEKVNCMKDENNNIWIEESKCF